MTPGKDYIGVSVFALIFNKEGEVVLVDHKPSDKKTEELADCWSMPGGMIEYGEKAEDALKREILEELGMVIDSLKLLNHNDYIREDRHWVALNYSAISENIPKNLEPGKIQAIKFFSLDDLPENTSAFTKECLALVKKGKNERG